MGCGASSVVDKALAKNNMNGLRASPNNDISSYNDMEGQQETKWLSDNEREREALVEREEVTDVKDLEEEDAVLDAFKAFPSHSRNAKDGSFELPGAIREGEARSAEEAQALLAAKTVVQEITKQIESGKANVNNPLLSDERRAQIAADCEELQKLIPLVVETTRDAFKNPDSQEKLRDIIKRIAELNERIEQLTKPEKGPILVVPKNKYNNADDVEREIQANSAANNDDFSKMKQEALKRHQQITDKRTPPPPVAVEKKPKKAERKVNANDLDIDDLDENAERPPQLIAATSQQLEEDANDTPPATLSPSELPLTADSVDPDKAWAKLEAQRKKQQDEAESRKRAEQLQNGSQDEGSTDDADKPWVKHKKQLVTKSKAFDNGDRYTGQFNSKGQQHGEGRYEFKNGDMYEGEFSNGKFDGKGKFTAANGDTYEGEFKDDMYHGSGKFFDAETGDKYEGEFDMGERKGYGVYFYANGDKYEGEFRNGEKHGKGKFTSFDGKTVYVGDYTQGKRHGNGIFIHKGNKYEGQFRNGKIQGKGAIFYENGNNFVGEFNKGDIDGKGVFTFANENKYEGVVRSDGTFSAGMLTFTNGDVYTGEFQGRKIHGHGFMVHANGDVYEGQFSDGKRHGKGKLTVSNGEVKAGDFNMGRYVAGPSWQNVDHGKSKEEQRRQHLEEEKKKEELRKQPDSELYQPKTGW